MSLLAAGGAHANEPALPLSPRLPVSIDRLEVTPMTTVKMNYARTVRPGEDEIARTSLAKALGSRQSAEAGFMCGLMPHPDTSGAAAAFGHDPHGRFVGAKLKVAF